MLDMSLEVDGALLLLVLSSFILFALRVRIRAFRDYHHASLVPIGDVGPRDWRFGGTIA